METAIISKSDIDAWLRRHVTAKEIGEKYYLGRRRALEIIVESLNKREKSKT